jgi:sodium/potassium-transporting ATPase subunit alpha
MEQNVGEKETVEQTRIRWQEDDEEAANPRNQLSQLRSNNSKVSVSRRGSIDPSTALPIQYRTLWA